MQVFPAASYPQMTRTPEMHGRSLLIFALISFLFGLALFSLPSHSCGDAEEACASDVNFCIACQLESDIHHTDSPAVPVSNFLLHIRAQLLLSPQERVALLLRPPIA